MEKQTRSNSNKPEAKNREWDRQRETHTHIKGRRHGYTTGSLHENAENLSEPYKMWHSPGEANLPACSAFLSCFPFCWGCFWALSSACCFCFSATAGCFCCFWASFCCFCFSAAVGCFCCFWASFCCFCFCLSAAVGCFCWFCLSAAVGCFCCFCLSAAVGCFCCFCLSAAVGCFCCFWPGVTDSFLRALMFLKTASGEEKGKKKKKKNTAD